MNDHSPVTDTAEPRSPAVDKRAAILDAALGLFAERTFAGTAVPQIAAAAGVATGTIYRYFPAKEAILNALYQHWKGELKRRLVSEPAADWHGELHRWWTTLTEFATEQPLAYRFLDLHFDDPHLDHASTAVALQLDAYAVALIERGQASGEIRDVPAALLVALVFGAFSGVARAVGVYGTELFGEDPFAAAEAAAWDLIRATPRPAAGG